MRKCFVIVTILLTGCGPFKTETMCNMSGEAYTVRRENADEGSNAVVYRAKDVDKLCKGLKNESVAS